MKDNDSIYLSLQYKDENSVSLDKESISAIRSIVNSLDISNIYYTFMENPDDFPEVLNGNDIDIIVNDLTGAIQIFKQHGCLIKKTEDIGFRGYLFVGQSGILVYDVLSSQGQTIFSKALDNCLKHSFASHYSSYKFCSKSSLLLFKSISITYGYVHSMYQIERLKLWYDELSNSDAEIFEKMFKKDNGDHYIYIQLLIY